MPKTFKMSSFHFIKELKIRDLSNDLGWALPLLPTTVALSQCYAACSGLCRIQSNGSLGEKGVPACQGRRRTGKAGAQTVDGTIPSLYRDFTWKLSVMLRVC